MFGRLIRVSIPEQRLTLLEAGKVAAVYPVSTARNGPGERRGSGCTPRGWHRIRIGIGAGLPLGTVFVGRRPTGEIYGQELAARYPERDWILTRILWLTGLESGYNRGGDGDTLRRFIYIHGCPDTAPMGVPLSHGCIRMRGQDLLELFERVTVGDRVFIAGQGGARDDDPNLSADPV
ncbi:MAG: L,D-transpeptidase [Candidatus Competibacter sp.]|nr:L,D-transpeptidase [Candidatus Competibacter sp.]MDG4583696.1 L,D-transpeptidase [Candidatus Competibacter sp.]